MDAVLLDGEAQMVELGLRISRHISRGSLILLDGPLGSGKTTFVKGLAAGLGVKEEVTSPTFLTVRVYPLPESGTFIHVDAYRVDDPFYLERQGVIDDLEAGAIVAVEWGSKVAVPSDLEVVWLRFSYQDATRREVQVLEGKELLSVDGPGLGC
jgi:tRNA threonylcarbamoyladenosine biosynthesis protein TsaE